MQLDFSGCLFCPQIARRVWGCGTEPWHFRFVSTPSHRFSCRTRSWMVQLFTRESVSPSDEILHRANDLRVACIRSDGYPLGWEGIFLEIIFDLFMQSPQLRNKLLRSEPGLKDTVG